MVINSDGKFRCAKLIATFANLPFNKIPDFYRISVIHEDVPRCSSKMKLHRDLPAKYAASTIDAVDRVWLSITKNNNSAVWNQKKKKPRQQKKIVDSAVNFKNPQIQSGMKESNFVLLISENIFLSKEKVFLCDECIK